MSSTETPGGRHRLADDGAEYTARRPAPRTPSPRRPSLVPRSVTVVAATVGAVFALGVDQHLDVPAPRPHPDAPGSNLAGPALQPVVPAQDDAFPARAASFPAAVTGHAIAGVHPTRAGLGGPADVAARTAAAFHAERVVDAVPGLAAVRP